MANLLNPLHDLKASHYRVISIDVANIGSSDPKPNLGQVVHFWEITTVQDSV